MVNSSFQICRAVLSLHLLNRNIMKLQYGKLMKGILLHVFIFIVLLCVACSRKESAAESEPLVRLAAVESTSGQETASYPGRTRATETVNMAFRVAGTIESVPVKAGDFVRKGQLVARLDDRDYRVQLSATEAEYNQIKAEAERIIALYNDNGTSANNYDKARFGLEQITAKYNNHKNQLADTRLEAPFDAYVQEVLYDGHETVGAGMPVVTLFSADGIEIVINIPASEYLRKENFESFNASFDVLPGRSFPLKLKSVAQKANANQLYEVRLLLEEKHPEVTPGMTAMVGIVYRPSDGNTLLVPANALFNRDGVTRVYVFDVPNSVIRQREVMVGALRLDGMAEITGGLKPGEQVVVAGVHHLKDGQAVKPFPEVSRTNIGGML